MTFLFHTNSIFQGFSEFHDHLSYFLYTAVSVSTFLHLSFLSASSPVVSMFTSFYFVHFVFSVIINDQCTFNCDRGSTVVKVLCYKSEGRWFDPS